MAHLSCSNYVFTVCEIGDTPLETVITAWNESHDKPVLHNRDVEEFGQTVAELLCDHNHWGELHGFFSTHNIILNMTNKKVYRW